MLLKCNILNNIFEILINYWKPILGLLFFVIAFILAVIRKKPLNPVFELIYNFAILAIQDAEVCSLVNPGFKGQDKLNRAVEYVKGCLKSNYPTLNVEAYTNIIIDTIEKILSCPSKKGGK